VAAVSRAGLLVGLAALGCGKLDEECRAVTARANAFLAETATLAPKQGASREQTQEQALAMALRYELLARDLGAIRVESDKLKPEVESYRALALRSASSLRAVAVALASSDFDTARGKRVELDAAGRGEGPLVGRINTICKH
jgi:hypothetical protein